MGELYPDNFERLVTPESQKGHAGGCDREPGNSNVANTDDRLRRYIIYSLPLIYDDDDRRESLLTGTR